MSYLYVIILTGGKYASKGKDGEIVLLDEYVLNKTILSEEEQNQILFALQGVKNITAK